MDLLDLLLDPLRSGIDRRALLEVALLGVVCGALGFWVVIERLSYAAESLSHGLLPGLVLAALAGAPLLLGAAGGVAVAAALIAVAARDPRIGPGRRHRRGGHRPGGPRRAAGAGARLAAAPRGAAVRRPARRVRLATWWRPRAARRGRRRALAALHRPLSATAFDADGAAALGAAPGPDAARPARAASPRRWRWRSRDSARCSSLAAAGGAAARGAAARAHRRRARIAGRRGGGRPRRRVVGIYVSLPRAAPPPARRWRWPSARPRRSARCSGRGGPAPAGAGA